ncbi:MAG: FAD:protein FMN transferase, partial [Boseongicola sp. SB0676_bin_33]|nr:FAD:protein FMN transferase [Boseongicola sp. SB0676_bin_33]
MTLSRRRTLRILAAGLAVPLGVLALQSTQGLPRPVRWHGEALGAVSTMTLWSVDPARASRALRRMQSEIARMEAIFSLFRPASELSRLNREGRLERPSRDMVEVLDLSRRIAEASRGAFDPTIQPLWALPAGSRAPDPRSLARVLPLV